MEHPVSLPCGCIAGSSCLERSLAANPTCPLCHTTDFNARPNRRSSTSARLRQLELETGLDDWPIPSVETSLEFSDGARTQHAARTDFSPREKLAVLNGCHGSALSLREVEVCVSLVDHRLGTSTSVPDALDAWFGYPLFEPARWTGGADVRGYMQGRLSSRARGVRGVEDLMAMGGVGGDVLMLINMRAGTSFLLHELELVVSLMNFIHRSDVGLLDVLGLRNGGLGGVEGELVGAFKTLDIRIGSRNAVEDLGDVFSQAAL